MYIDIVFHPTSDICLEDVIDKHAFRIVKVGVLPDTDGEVLVFRLDVIVKISWEKFRDAVKRLLKICRENDAFCSVEVVP